MLVAVMHRNWCRGNKVDLRGSRSGAVLAVDFQLGEPRSTATAQPYESEPDRYLAWDAAEKWSPMAQSP